MSRRLLSSGSAFEAAIGYSRAVIDGEWVFVSGCTGYDYSTGVLPTSIHEQVERAMYNVNDALTKAGSSINEVVRVRYILPDRSDFPACWPILSKWFGEVRPAATMIQAGLMDEAMKFEVEVTAKKPTGAAISLPPP